MSGQVRSKGIFIKKKTFDYEVRQNSGLIEERKRKYSAGYVISVKSVYEGRRIVVIQELVKNMECFKCQ